MPFLLLVLGLQCNSRHLLIRILLCRVHRIIYALLQDELLWAATWLYVATRKSVYLKYVQEESISASVAEFSWDLKYVGAQVLLSKVLIMFLIYFHKLILK